MSIAAAAKSLQSCPTLCNPIDSSPPGSPVPGILQARTLEQVAISFSNAWKWKVKVKSLSRVWLLATPWTAAYQGPLSMGFSKQEYWSGVPLPSPMVFARWYQFPLSFLRPFIYIPGKGGSLGRFISTKTWKSDQSLPPCPDHTPTHVSFSKTMKAYTNLCNNGFIKEHLITGANLNQHSILSKAIATL